MRLAQHLNVTRTSARLMSTHFQPSLTRFETSLTENARQLLGNQSPTTVLPLVRKVRARLPYLTRATRIGSSHTTKQAQNLSSFCMVLTGPREEA